MLKSRKLAAYALGGFLLLGSGGLAMAQTATTTNPNTTTVSRTDSTHDRNFDWGWLGLLGLVGGLLAVGGLVLTKVLFVDRTLAGPIKAGIITGIDWSQIALTGLEITAAGVLLAGLASYVTLRLYVRL